MENQTPALVIRTNGSCVLNVHLLLATKSAVVIRKCFSCLEANRLGLFWAPQKSWSDWPAQNQALKSNYRQLADMSFGLVWQLFSLATRLS